MDKELIAAWDNRFPSDEAKADAIASIKTLARNTEHMSNEAIAEQAEKIVNELLGV